MAEILLGSHVGMSGKEMFLGSVKTRRRKATVPTC